MNYKCKIIAQLVKLTILITILTFLGNVLIIGQLPWFFEKAGDCGLESDITICGDEKPSLYLDEAEYIATGSWTFPFLRKLISSYFGEESTRTTSFEFLRKIMNPYFKADCGSKRDIILFTNEELSRCNGEDNQELYLAILGVVYDVTKGKKHYGPGESYHAFIGRDASQSFITGDFNADNLSDDISKLSGEQLLSLYKWKDFYDTQYTRKGKLIGRYFDSNGNPTEYSKMVDTWVEQAKSEQNMKQTQEKMYPPCNIEWNAESGTRVWCTDKSGGIDRNWVGYPVKYFEQGSNSVRCACVKSYIESSSIAFYDDCHEKTSCFIKEED